jgi:hypothetical protein
MKIVNTLDKIHEVYPDGSFSLSKWQEYLETILPGHSSLFLDDMNQTIALGNYTFKEHFLPILQAVYQKPNEVQILIKNFEEAAKQLEEQVLRTLGKPIDVEIILYLGLCNGAGWVVDLEQKPYLLVGVEKVLELQWYDLPSFQGLLYHELGHLYQRQYGVLDRQTSNPREHFLWQLLTEGVAMYCEQLLVQDFSFFHQDRDGWLDWCDQHLQQIKQDFDHDIDSMTQQNQRYFGDWVRYEGYSDVGYYLGAKFVRFIAEQYSLYDIINMDHQRVNHLFEAFMEI